MSARHKLNAAHVIGSLIAGAAVGVLFQSWAAFAISSVALVLAALTSGDIRVHGRK